MKWFLSHALPSSIALRSQESCVIFIYTLNQIVIFFLLNSLLSKGKGKVPFLHFFFWIKLEDNQIKKNIKAETMVWWASIGLNPEKPVSQFCSVTQSCPILWPHGLQHASLPCPLPTPWACSNSCPLSQWCHPTISSSVTPFSSRLQSFPASGLCQWVSSLHQVAKVLELQLQHHSFQ